MSRPAARLAVLVATATLVTAGVAGPALAIDGPLETSPLVASELSVATANNPYRIYAVDRYDYDGARSQTVYRSIDFGSTWTPIPGPTNFLVGRIGTIEADCCGLYVADGYRILKYSESSPDAAAWSWQGDVPGPSATKPENEYVEFLGAYSSDRPELFALPFAGRTTGLYRSGDTFTQWDEVPFTGIPSDAAVNEIAPAESTGITYLRRPILAAVSPAVEGASSGGVYLSMDSGDTWDRVGLSGKRVRDVAFQTGSTAIGYAATGYDDQALYRTTNGGSTWSALPGPKPWSDQWFKDVQASSRGYVVVMASYGPPVPDRPIGVFLSRDRGETFEEIPLGYQVGNPRSMTIHYAGYSLHVAGDRGVGRYWLGDVTRLYGPSRFETAARVSQHMYPAAQSADAVVLATSHNFPDAIAAAPLATSGDAPILLAHASLPLSDTTKNEVVRVLEPGGTTYLVGGEDVVPTSVATELAGLGYKVVRVAGPTRYETAVAIAERLPDPDAVFVAVGTDFPDALCAAPPASVGKAPVLFTRTGALPTSVRTYLAQHPDIERAYIVGDTSVVSSAVERELQDLVGDVERLGGQTRYDTAYEVAERFYPGDPEALGVATGADFPDALAGTVLCSEQDGPMLLTPPVPPGLIPSNLGWHIEGYLAEHDPTDVYTFGGPDVVFERAVEEIERIW